MGCESVPASRKEIILDWVVSESLPDKVAFGLRSTQQQGGAWTLVAHAWSSKCRGPEEEWTWLILQGVKVRRDSNLGHRWCPALALPKNNLGHVLSLHHKSQSLQTHTLPMSLWLFPLGHKFWWTCTALTKATWEERIPESLERRLHLFPAQCRRGLSFWITHFILKIFFFETEEADHKISW